METGGKHSIMKNIVQIQNFWKEYWRLKELKTEPIFIFQNDMPTKKKNEYLLFMFK